MADPLMLIGFGPSVYTRIVRLALKEMGLDARYEEVDPFVEAPDPGFLALNPVGRVPVLKHEDFTLSETGAILQYLDFISPKPSFVPASGRAAARMAQVTGLVDAHLYVPLVRRVFAQGWFAPHRGEPHDPHEVAVGLVEAAPALTVLDRIAAEGLQLNGRDISLADMHLAPMIAYGVCVPEARAAIMGYPALWRWWEARADWPALTQTDPFPTG